MLPWCSDNRNKKTGLRRFFYIGEGWGAGLFRQRLRQLFADLAQHLFQDARVGNHDVAGVFVVVTTYEVGDDGTRFFGQQFTGSGVPGLEADFR